MEEIDHFIERYIFKSLAFTASARFASMRPPRVDSNLYTYHLSKLLKLGYITKNDRDYSLSPKGLAYVDRLSFDTLKPALQAKINTGIILKTLDRRIVLTKRRRQPFIEKWGLPMGKLHAEDKNILNAAERELFEKTGLSLDGLEHIGDVYLRFLMDEQLISNAFCHFFGRQIDIDAVNPEDGIRLVSINSLSDDNIIRGVDRIVELADSSDGFFFAELEFHQ